MNLNVILRTCDKVTAFSAGNKPRDFGTKKEVIYKCASSLKNSIDYFEIRGGVVKVTVVDDHSSKDTLNFLESKFPNSLISLSDSGNGVSFGKCLDLALKCEGLVFFVEDDYLLKEECIHSMVNSYHKLKKQFSMEVCIHPTDYPDRYQKLYPSYIVLGSDRHYRTIRHTTCTFMYDVSIFKEFEKQLRVFCDYGKVQNITEDNSINLVYGKYPCFSPIPYLADHLQYNNTLSVRF